MSVAFEVVEDPARACAALMISAAIGGGQIVLAGGSTPEAANERFVEAVRTVGLGLEGTTFWVGDERCVEPDDGRSNYRMIRESLIEPLAGITEARVERIHGELGPEAGAEDYDSRLRAAGPAHFDLVLLGIGPDGHTASLFPGQATLSVRDRLVVGVPEAGLEPFVPRVSLTLPALTATPQVVVLASGASKAEAIAQAFGPGTRPDPAVPSSLLVPAAALITVLLDPAAASELEPAR
ncbi:MAG: 6-phosphogluconolactonase [Solirubrobacterales bacterium]|nr:6-phosphogluconolactonase [Solirubrobacterales bacterium]